MLATLASWVPYLVTPLVGILYLRQDGRVFRFVGYSLMASFGFTTMQLGLALWGTPNVMLQRTWPLVTTLLIIWGVGRNARVFGAIAVMMLSIGLVGPIVLPEPKPFILAVSGILLSATLWRSEYHRKGLEAGLWFYYILPLPVLLVVLWLPGLFSETQVFIYRRTCQLLGVLILAAWLRIWVYGWPRRISFLESRLSLFSVSPNLTISTKTSSQTGTKPLRNSGKKSRPSPSTSKLRKI